MNQSKKSKTSPDQHQVLINDMLRELDQVLDQHVVSRIANRVDGLKVSDQAKVKEISADPQAVVQGLVDEFVGLSNDVVVKTLQPLLKQCPWIKVPMLEK